ncbi:DMT family transporter [Achromobacter sp. K91]|jgi:drug/metabolite transporter (DMT)-like permease|uniref:DMT family transporter n=1 Tax=Achromobacter TaxID=222 RepID=UPI000E66CA9C|nr:MULTISPECIES: DMT family transporter [Achromobacter]MBD9433297.1 DMT family transporter [Achromobacter sp. ACM03]MBD9476524.1 DMT family transporter [Achromobacter sp. ACM01]MDQ1763853.1 DMT family transporter [Achromobacter aegrifaciens]RIJ00356.1 DMT family transporter [Achromobacter sp. K91]RSF03015.1 DMT family transporter [Achromobacter aegrifaciens]
MSSVPIALPSPAAARQTGILLFFAALVAFATFDAGSKHMLARYPAPFLNIMRYSAVAVLAVALLWRHRGGLRLRDAPEKPLLILRGLLLATVGTCFMTALIWMPLSEATAIYFTSPLIMVALSPWLLGERVRPAQWTAVAAGFGGMLLIVRPGSNLPWLGTLLMAVSAVSYAVFQVLTRRLSGKVPGPIQYAYTAFICLVVTGLPAPFFLPDPWPDLADMLFIVGLGACSGLAQIFLISAFQRVAAATLAPLNYFQLLLAVLFSTFWFQRPPDGLALAGMGLIIASGVFLALRRG